MPYLGCLLYFGFFSSFGNDGSVGGHHSKKDPALFGDGVAGIDFVQQVVVLFIAKAALEPGSSFLI